MEHFVNWLHNNDISLVAVVATVAIVLVTPILIAASNRVVRAIVRRGERRLHLPYSTVLIVTRVVSAGLWLIAATVILNVWGFSLGGLWTLMASAIAVIGVGFLAVWTMVSNVTAGFFITVWRPFSLGETVEVLPEQFKGRVIDRNLMFTVLREEGGSVLQVPNNFFFQRMFRVDNRSQRSLLESLESDDVPISPGGPKRS